MSKKAFDTIIAGLQDALGYAKGDQLAVARVVHVHVEVKNDDTNRKIRTMKLEPQTQEKI